MRLGLGLATALASLALLLPLPACQSTSPDIEDAGPDVNLPTCQTDKDCPSGMTCAYPVVLGCNAKGVCFDFADAEACTTPAKGCACDDGGVVDIPACYNGFGYSPAPVTGLAPCGD